MSRFFAYFEIPNSTCDDYSCFNQVGKFVVPELIFVDNIKINFQQKLVHGAIISDFSMQANNDYFAKTTNPNTQLLKITLLNFLTQRLNLPCIQAYLMPFIFDNKLEKENILNIDKPVKIIKINNNSDFDFSIFKQDFIFHLTK